MYHPNPDSPFGSAMCDFTAGISVRAHDSDTLEKFGQIARAKLDSAAYRGDVHLASFASAINSELVSRRRLQARRELTGDAPVFDPATEFAFALAAFKRSTDRLYNAFDRLVSEGVADGDAIENYGDLPNFEELAAIVAGWKVRG